MTSHQDNQKKLEQLKLKITNIAAALHEGLVGREEVIKVALLGVLSRENTILFGPPGTAKSEIARRISKVIGNGYFEYLLTKFTTPEEIFGPLSIAKLKQDQFERNTQGFLPTAQIGFLDEIFKANSSILNTLLTILNERIFHNGHTRQDVPLVSLISASNELPLNDNELSALYDRFLFKYVVDYLPESKIRQLFDISPSHNNKINQINFTQQDLDTVSANLGLVEIPDEIKDLMIEIRNQYNETFKEDKTETLSDRRFVKLIKIVKVSALTNARMVVDQSDLLVLCHCLWNNPSNKDNITQLVSSSLQNIVGSKQNDHTTQIYRVKKHLSITQSQLVQQAAQSVIFRTIHQSGFFQSTSMKKSIIAYDYDATNPYVIVHDGKTCELLGVSSLEAGVHCRFVCVQGSLPKKIKLEGMKSEYDFDEVFEAIETKVENSNNSDPVEYHNLVITNIWL